MAMVKRRSLDRYSARQAAQRKSAADDMAKYVIENADNATFREIVAKGTVTARKHGRASAALASVWYDRIAREAGADVPKAVPSVVANSGRIGAQVTNAWGLLEGGDVDGFATACARAVSNEVKRSASRTMLQNAARDGAEYAWVPQGGETCAFCITLASNGWQRAKRSTAMGDHADHIHPNCECEFSIRFDKDSGVAGYDPKQYEDEYKDADGRNSKDKINAMRREKYADNKDKINAQHRERYAATHQTEE